METLYHNRLISKFKELDDKVEIFDYINEKDYSIEEIKSFLKYINSHKFERYFNNETCKSEKADFLIKLFENLKEYDFFGAKKFLEYFCNDYTYECLFTRFDEFMKLVKDTKITNKNSSVADTTLSKKYIDLLHTEKTSYRSTDEDKKVLLCDSLLKKCTKSIDTAFLDLHMLSFKCRDMICKGLAYIDTSDIDRYFGDNLYYHESYQNKYFGIMKYKGVTEFISKLENFVGKFATGEKISLIEHIFNDVLDRSFDSDEDRDEFLKDIKENTLLGLLTRGELQYFLDASDLCSIYKLALIDTCKYDLFTKDVNALSLGRNNFDLYYSYTNYIKFLNDNIEREIRKRNDYCKELFFNVYEKNDDYKKLMEYSDINLLKILCEESLPLRYKWLDESIDYKENQNAYEDDEEDEESVNGFKHEFILDTIREFYNNLGINYDGNSLNDQLPRKIYFGFELEEEGYRPKGYKMENHNHFYRVADASIKYTVKGKGKENYFYKENDDTSEYVSTLCDSKDEKDVRVIDKFLNEIAFVGGKPNSTCGFHIHLSSDFTENIDEYDFISLYGMPSDYKSETYPDCKDKEIYEEGYLKPGFDVAYKICNEIFNMQDLIMEKFLLYRERIRQDGYAQRLRKNRPDMEEKYNFVNFASLQHNKGIEFRFLNLPDYTDKKVIDAFLDFSTSYFAYMEEGNDTVEYVKDALDEVYNSDFELERPSGQDLKDLEFDILLSELSLKDDTVVVLKNLDKIFELYNCKDQDSDMNYYDMYDKKIYNEFELLEDEDENEL